MRPGWYWCLCSLAVYCSLLLYDDPLSVVNFKSVTLTAFPLSLSCVRRILGSSYFTVKQQYRKMGKVAAVQQKKWFLDCLPVNWRELSYKKKPLKCKWDCWLTTNEEKINEHMATWLEKKKSPAIQRLNLVLVIVDKTKAHPPLTVVI